MRPLLRYPALGLLTAFFACSDPAGVTSSEHVRVEADGPGIVIHNGRPAKIFYTVLDASFAARANWAPCVDPVCPGVASGERISISSDHIGGWGESDEVIAYWWHVYRTPSGEFYLDAIRALRVRL